MDGILIVITGLAVGLLVLGVVFHKKQLTTVFENSQAESKRILDEARKEADVLVKAALREAKEEAQERRKTFEEEAKKRRAEVAKLEAKIKQRETTLDKKLAGIETRETGVEETEKKLAASEKRQLRLIADYEVALERNQKTLEKIASMSADEAKRELMSSLEDAARKEAQTTIRQIEEDARRESEIRARSVISLSVQRLASEYVNDASITVVALPAEDIKGRIIGREGRNIRAIEQATGVDLIIDDTPEAVIISCFNPIRREIAKLTLERLIADGRIHPARIEETVKRVEGEFATTIREYGEQAAFDIAVTDIHPELLAMLGKLRFRTAGMQSVLQHAVEVAHICGIMAGEMGVNVKRAKRAGLLHDIGKAVDQETEGHHAETGAALCERHGEHRDVINAVRQHHTDDLANASALTVILHTANSLSESRPGARREVLESYIKRLDAMEQVIKSFKGIDSAFVLQAGREVRALVTPEGVSDEEVRDLSNNIAYKLRQELTFPGQVRVTVLRESKYVDFAK